MDNVRSISIAQASRSQKEERILSGQREPMRAMLEALKGTQCPNCYETLPPVPALTPTGVAVCNQDCVRGWMSGEECKRTLAVVRKIRELISD